MGSKIEKCAGMILKFYDVDTGLVSNQSIRGDEYDFYEPNAMVKFKGKDWLLTLLSQSLLEGEG